MVSNAATKATTDSHLGGSKRKSHGRFRGLESGHKHGASGRRGGEMTKTRKIVLLTIALVSLDGLLTHGQSQVARVETPLRPEEHDRLFVIGKRLFVECCAKCHATDAGARKTTRALLTLQWNCAKVTNVPAAHASKAFEAAQCFRSFSRSEEHTSELQSRPHLVCRLLLEKKKKKSTPRTDTTA